MNKLGATKNEKYFYEYDELFHPIIGTTQHSQLVITYKITPQVEYSYDAFGRRISTSYPEGDFVETNE